MKLEANNDVKHQSKLDVTCQNGRAQINNELVVIANQAKASITHPKVLTLYLKVTNRPD